MTASLKDHPSLTSQASWLLSARIAGFGFTFLIPVALTRLLDQSQFGLYRQAFLVIATSQTILPLGFGRAAFYFLPRETARRGSVILNTLLVNIVVGVSGCLVLWLYPQLLGIILGSEELVPHAGVIGAVVLFWIFSAFLEVVATAEGAVLYSTAFIILAQLTKSLFLIAAAFLYPSVLSLLYAALLQGAVQTVILIWYLVRKFPGFWRQPDWMLLREQVSYTLPLGFAGLAVVLRGQLDRFFVAHSTTPELFAIYAIGCTQVPLIQYLRESVVAVMLARLSKLQKEGNRREILQVTVSASRKVSAVFLPTYFLLIVVGREFIVTLFTERYEASWPIFSTYITLIPLLLFVTEPALRAFKEVRFFLLLVRCVSVTALVLLLTPSLERFGLLGAAYCVILVSVAEQIILAMRALLVLKARWQDLTNLLDVLKVLAAAATAALVTAGTRWLLIGVEPLVILIVCTSMFGAVYGLLVWKSGYLTDDERTKLTEKVAQCRRLMARPGR